MSYMHPLTSLAPFKFASHTIYSSLSLLPSGFFLCAFSIFAKYCSLHFSLGSHHLVNLASHSSISHLLSIDLLPLKAISQFT